MRAYLDVGQHGLERRLEALAEQIIGGLQQHADTDMKLILHPHTPHSGKSCACSVTHLCKERTSKCSVQRNVQRCEWCMRGCVTSPQTSGRAWPVWFQWRPPVSGSPCPLWREGARPTRSRTTQTRHVCIHSHHSTTTQRDGKTRNHRITGRVHVHKAHHTYNMGA
jgi:hypothetical protein